MPPWTKPQRTAFSPPRRPCSDASGCKRYPPNAGRRSPRLRPSVARVTLICGDSNHSSRKSAALCVKDLGPAPKSRADPDVRKRASRLQIFDEIARLFRRQFGRRHPAAATRQLPPVAPGKLRISDEPAHRARRILAISASVLQSSCQKNRCVAIWISGKERRVFRQYLITEALQFQFPDDTLLQKADEIRAGGDAITRPYLLGDARSRPTVRGVPGQRLSCRHAPGMRRRPARYCPPPITMQS